MNYQTERDAMLRRFYGGNPKTNSRRPGRNGPEPITKRDCLGIPIPVNLAFRLAGYCLVWTHGLDTGGYGVISIDGKPEKAHRVAFLQSGREIPDGMQINHLCNRPYCIQPAHLYAGTPQDNRDDLEISQHEGFMSPADIVMMQPQADFDDPLLQRIRDSNRWEYVEPREAPEQPPQIPMEEFSCPRHDFRITTQQGGRKICRICEKFEEEGKFYDRHSIFLMARHICPVSQTVPFILDKLAESKLATEEWKGWRVKHFHRTMGLGGPDHEPRTCECYFCTQDRRMMQEALAEKMTPQEGDILDICDLMRPKIEATLRNAAADVLEEAARPLELSNTQVQELRGHLPTCPNTRNENRQAADIIEMAIGYSLHAMHQFKTTQEVVDESEFSRFIEMVVRTPNRPTESVIKLLQGPAGRAREELMEALEEDSRDFALEAFPDGETEVLNGIRNATSNVLTLQIFDILRYHLEGKSSSGSTSPHPHQYCIDSLLETGKVERFQREIEEGQGFTRLG